MTAVNIPCAVQNCHNEAYRVVKTKFAYYEWVYTERRFRWVHRDDFILLDVCRDHRNKWIRRGTTLTTEGAVL